MIEDLQELIDEEQSDLNPLAFSYTQYNTIEDVSVLKDFYVIFFILTHEQIILLNK